ncbi:protein mono-ADP-ribosyltransferase PARP14-like [Dromiciops gliroides]|uniref:protein mono-ADP-ribosyltransferase PARP14-like n=1 Tax=Dromiciops gliroides TaxID=33562 RepID=UPI001CC3B377|nr:protein mono-ADP-ribosyltransferase PARP14-like [Dromiciops gliroides]
METADSFPLVLEGPWDPDPPKKLCNKLLCYFQSPRRSGGGECVLEYQSGDSGLLLLLFEQEEATQQQGPLPGTGQKMKLHTKWKPAGRPHHPLQARSEVYPPVLISSLALKPSESQIRQRVLERQNHELELPGEEKLKLTVRLPTAKDGNTIRKKLVPTKDSKIKDGTQEKEASEHQNTTLPLERSAKTEIVSKGPRTTSSWVAFKNVPDTMTHELLVLLVENISGLSEPNGDFTVEIRPEAEVAVVTFLKIIDVKGFITTCAQNHTVGKLKISVEPLYVTRTILVEDLPPDVDEYYITHFFQNPNNGGGPVTRVQCFPKENSALVWFGTCKVVDTILTKKLLFNNSPISVFPYYHSLGTALYGKAKSSVKLPEPLKVPMEPYLLKFLQKDDQVIGEITSTMESYHCALTWPRPNCKEPEIILTPSVTLVTQRKTKSDIIKTWSEDVSKKFSCLISKYQVRKFNVDREVWEAIRDSIENKNILTEFDKLQETVIIAGELEDVQRTESKMTLIERTTQKIKRKKQSIRENLTVGPGRFSILHNKGLEETLQKEYPKLEVTYDALRKRICLSGLAADVYKAKSEILEKLQSLVQKSLHVSPHIIQFLQQVNCETFSESLFGAKKLSAACELEGEAVVLVGSSSQVLSEAEEHMKKALSLKCIDMVNQRILNDCKWKTLIGELNKKYNCSSKTVIIEQQNSDTGVKIIIAGCVSPVCESHQLLCKFIEKNTKIKKFIAVISLAIIQYMKMKMENRQIWHELRIKNIKISFKTLANQRGILLSGPKEEVMRAVAMVKQTLDSICIRNFSIDKPGAKSLFKEKEAFYKMEAKQKYSCSICLLEDGDESNGSSIDGQKVHCELTLESGILLTVQQGDLTQFSADVVVNAANKNLQHLGGLAAALSKAAGPELQRECDQIIQQQGKIPPGCAVVSSAGQLPYQQVIHAVGPRWKQEDAHKCVQLLKNAITECLTLAGSYGHSSIAIPALSSGIFGFPLKECAENIVLSIKENFQDLPNQHSLKKIHLVDSSEETVRALSKAVKNIFKDLLPDKNSAPCTQSGNQDKNRKKKIEWGNVLASIQTREGLSILLVKGDIQDAETDLIVNSVPWNLQLDNKPSTLSGALLKKAGPHLQEELNEVGKGKSVRENHVFLTKGYNLDCRFVLHVVAPSWDNGEGNSQKAMEDIITACLKMTTVLSLESITFPTIGTGNLGFPKVLFAELILSQVLKFSRRPLQTLKEVHFLLYPSDTENIEAFSELFRWINGNPTSDRVAVTNDTQGLFGTISNPDLGVYEMKIGSITFQVASGDIIKENSDVIINSTNATFVLKTGVSKAILEAAGPAVKLKCAILAKQPHDNFIVTQGGNLKCKKIIHVLGVNDVKESFSKVLQECEKRKYTSISLPAIGTGNAGQDPAKVAENIIDAIEDFACKGSAQFVKKVKVVIFLPQLLKVFYDSMKKRRDFVPPIPMLSELKSILGLASNLSRNQDNLVLEKKKESTIFQVCGENKDNIESTISWTQDLISKEQNNYAFSDESIRNFGGKEYKELNELQRSLDITITMEHGSSCLRVLGIARDVLKASQMIEDMIKRVRLHKDEESKAELLSGIIEWQYNDSGVFKSFDKITNMHLEDARKEKKSSIDIKIENENYTVDFHNNIATGEMGQSFPIKRLTKSEGELPEYWDDMEKQNFLLVKLQPGKPEYMAIENHFNQNCSDYKIEKIERIQNRNLWNLYNTRKKNMDDQNGHTNNEKRLFHGTAADSVSHVNSQGFNRSYAGKNAIAWGKGTYFAVSARYSADDRYSKPDINGKKYMYYARVLTGDYILGDSSFVVPPPKSTQDSNILYDSVTDNIQNPTLFVIFYDSQSYPDYLITFSK